MYRKVIYLISVTLASGLMTSPAKGADPNLVGLWRFDEGGGTIVHDASGNDNNGILMGGAKWTTGRFGGGIELDGTSGYVSIPSFELTTDTITFVIWLKGWKGANWAPLISSREFTACEMNFGDNDTLHYTWNNDSSLTWNWRGGPVIPQDTWTMLAVTIDPAAATAYVYTDAGGLAKGTNSMAHIQQTVGALQIGYSYSLRYVRGIVDEAAIFSKALTEDEILALVPGVGEGYPYAMAPDPADGEMLPATWVELSWRPGEFARSHDVYFSDSFEAVHSGTPEAFQGNQAETTFIAGLDGFAYPQGLVPGSTYYWRIDEVNDADPNSPWKGSVWSFWIPPRQAYNPRPAEGQMFVPTTVTLEWTPGLDAERHRVYIGENFDDVNNATGGTLIRTTTFTPAALQFDKKYYWRVDEFDPPLTYRGAVWSFTTAIEGLGTALMDRWENIPGSDIEALKNDPNYPKNPDVTETVTSFAWNGPNLSNYGARIEAWLYVPLTGDYTFWLNSDDHGELWLSTNDDPSNAVLIAQESSHTVLDEWGTGEEQSAPITLVAGCKYYIAALWKEGTGNDHCQVAWQGPGAPQRIIIPGQYLSPFKPMAAYGARPANEATGVKQRPALRWKPGLAAAWHEVYFGTDEAAVREATPASALYQGRRPLGEERFIPGQLPWASTFFWRIDEVNDAHPESPWTGEVWSFTTADYLVVDDFEDYTDDDIVDGAIWQHWLDGFGVSANGSQVGYVRPPFAEKTVVHGGRQSMPLFYNNSAGVTNSEAELTLDWPRDWTEGGVTTLSLWFKGRPASLGRFVEEPPGTFTVTGLGILGMGIIEPGDEFHFAYKKLTGPGTIIARLDSLQDTADWAIAGVMIRESLEPGSRHALAAVTSDQEVVSESRLETDGAALNYTQQEIAAPRWLKLQRDAAGNFAAFHSADGSTWVPVKGAVSQNIPMRATVYVGLAVAGYSADLTCQAVFSQVQITGDVTGAWEHQDVGIAANVAEPLYVAVSNAGGPAVVVTHENPNAAVTPAWTQWRIDLSRFSGQGIDLRDIEHIAIGLGARGDAAADGGSGVMFFDDITLLRPPGELQP